MREKIEKLEVRQVLNEYLKTIHNRKQSTRNTADELLESGSTSLAQQVIRSSSEYQILRTKSQVYNEIIDDIFNLLEKFEEEEN